MNERRLIYIDIAKAMGICLVVLSHTVFPHLMHFAIGCFVPIFFVASGYTIKNIKLQKKIRSLLFPYLLFNCILLALYIVFCIIKKYSYSDILTMVGGILYSRYCLYPLGMPENIFLLKIGNAPLWFLTSMFTAYVAFKPLLKFTQLRFWIITVYIGITIILARLPILLPWSIDCAFLMALFLFVGVKLKESDFLNNNSLIVWCILLCGYSLVTILNGYENLSVRDYGESVLLCLASGGLGSILILKFSKFISNYKIGKCLAVLGEHSLIIFCIQMPLLFISRIFIGQLTLLFMFTIKPEIVALIQMFMTISIGYVISRVFFKSFPEIFK